MSGRGLDYFCGEERGGGVFQRSRDLGSGQARPLISKDKLFQSQEIFSKTRRRCEL